LMTELLGRNWTALTPMLREGGDAIRENAASQADGLIVTEKQAQAAEDMRIAQDKLNDSWVAFRNTVGNEVIPDLTRAFDDLNKASEWFTTQEPSKAIGSIGVAAGMSAEQVARLKRELELAQTPAEHLKEQEEGYKKLAASYGYVADSAGAMVSQQKEQLTTGEKWLKHMLAEKETTSDLAAAQERWAYDQVTLAQTTNDLGTATDNLKKDQQSLNESMGSEAVSAIEKSQQSFARQLAAMKIQDEAFGTHAAVTAQRSKDIDDATRAFMNSPQTEADKAAYLSRLDEIKTKYTNLDDAIEKDKTKVRELQDVIDNLHGKDIYINVITQQNQAAGLGGITPVQHYEGEPATGGGHWHWDGSRWEVFYGYQFGGAVGKGQSVMVGEHGPEMFTPGVGGNITNNWSLTINSHARTEQVASDFHLMKSLYSPGA